MGGQGSEAGRGRRRGSVLEIVCSWDARLWVVSLRMGGWRRWFAVGDPRLRRILPRLAEMIASMRGSRVVRPWREERRPGMGFAVAEIQLGRRGEAALRKCFRLAEMAGRRGEGALGEVAWAMRACCRDGGYDPEDLVGVEAAVAAVRELAGATAGAPPAPRRPASSLFYQLLQPLM